MCLKVSEREPAGPRPDGWTEGLLSIFEETGGGLPAVGHDRSLELFCDRDEVIAHFVSLINDDPPRRRLLYLQGLGGNGKSLLLRFLAARCCVRLPPAEWERVRRLPEAELPAVLGGAAKAARVPVARIDFGARPVGEMRPQECFSALFMLKQQLSDLPAQLRQLLALVTGHALGIAALDLVPGQPVTQRALTDPQVTGHLRDRLPGLPHDPDRTLAELRIELPSLLRHGYSL
jgi:hypothetical protein